MDGIQVTMEDVAKVIELWTGIPAAKVKETEYTKLAHLEENLNRVIIGQPEAVHLVANAVKRSRADISARRRPASFIFVGPTGVGKTELVSSSRCSCSIRSTRLSVWICRNSWKSTRSAA